MRAKLEILDLTVVVRAHNHNPSILNPDFLKYNEIVPAEWELAENPVGSELASQVKYKNGLGIVAQPNKIIFGEDLAGTSAHEPRVPDIAKKYTETLPHVNYDALGINPKGLVVAESGPEAETFLLNKVVKPGPWKTYAGGAKGVKLTFHYWVNDARMTLEAESGKTGEHALYAKGTPILLFSANFHRPIISTSRPTERIEQLHKGIDRWHDDLTEFESAVNDCFLKGGQTDA
jgi:hypothetical protein